MTVIAYNAAMIEPNATSLVFTLLPHRGFYSGTVGNYYYPLIMVFSRCSQINVFEW